MSDEKTAISQVGWLTAVKMKVFKAFPYLSTALYSMKMIPDDRIIDPAGNPTMGVDKFWRMYYNPKVEDRWTVDEGAIVLYHEMWHLLREHAQRCEEGDRQAQVWNQAADAEINRGDLPYGLKWPADALTSQKLQLPDEGLAEDYYTLLMDRHRQECPVHGKNRQKQQQGQDKQQQQQGGQGQEGQDQQDQGQGQGQGDQKQQGQGQGDCTCSHGQPDSNPTKGGCGSGAHGQQMPHDQPDPTPGDRSQGLSQEEAKRVAYEVAAAVKREEHEKNSERGDIPGFIKRWAELIVAGPQVDWRKVFRAKVKRAIAFQAGRGESTYTRRSRRQHAVPDIILPGQRKPVIRVGLQVDTSGSMSEDEIAAILNELRAILGAGETQGVFVLAVDAAVHWSGYVTNINQVQLKGGGGTDMGVGIEFAANQKPPISVLIVATDTYTPWPKERPKNLEVIVVSTNANGTHPEWSDYLYIDPKKLVQK